MDTTLIARLIVAHLAGDFLLQPDRWVADRNARHFRSGYLYLHALVQSILAFMAIADWQGWWIALSIGIGHLVFDGCKAASRRSDLLWFVADQLLHIVVIIACVEAHTHFIDWQQFTAFFQSTSFWYVATAYLMVVTLYSRFIAFATMPWRADIPAEREPLKAAGRWIGIIERVLVLTFVLEHEFAAVGFLLAAKSVLRFGDLRESKDKSHTEYVMIGTLISFGLTIITGLLLNWLLIGSI